MAKTKVQTETPGQQDLFGKEGQLYSYLAWRVRALAEEVRAQEKKLKTGEIVLKTMQDELERVKAMKKGLEGAAPEPKKEQV